MNHYDTVISYQVGYCKRKSDYFKLYEIHNKIDTKERSVMGVIVSDHIEQECLNLISMYADIEYNKKNILKAYGNLSAEKQQQISIKIKSYIEQAISFLQETDENVFSAPLTLFYAINNFSKAVFYVKKPNETMAGTHGINLVTRNNELERILELGKIQVAANENGTFASLLDITGDELTAGTNICLKDVFSVIPELREVYYMRYSEEPNLFLLKQIGSKGSSYELFIQSADTHELKQRDYSLLEKNSMHIGFELHEGSIWVDADMIPEKKKNATYTDIFGNIFATNGILVNSNNIKLSKFACLYMCYYAFSMLVRYNPDKWNAFCNSADIAIIKKLLISCRREMLVEILQLLNNEDYTFMTKIEVVADDLDGLEVLKALENQLRSEKRRTSKNPLLGI